MFDSLSAWPGYILMCTGTFHSDVNFCLFLLFWDHKGLRLWCIRLFSILIFGYFPFSWFNYWIFAGWKLLIGGFSRFTGWWHYEYASTICTLRVSTLVNGFDWYAISIWVMYWITCWSFSWYAPLTGTLGGTAGGFAFLNISAGVLNVSVCPFPSLTSGISGDGFCSALIEYRLAWNVAYVEDICGMLIFLGGNSSVSNILSALLLGVYSLFHL